MENFKILLILSACCLMGCAALPEYNPVVQANKGEYELNQQGLNSLHPGMTLDQVHAVMGQELLFGYSLDQHKNYWPRTIANPIKTETLITPSGAYFVEYYVSRIVHADDTITNDELTPIYFKDGQLVTKPRD